MKKRKELDSSPDSSSNRISNSESGPKPESDFGFELTKHEQSQLRHIISSLWKYSASTNELEKRYVSVLIELLLELRINEREQKNENEHENKHGHKHNTHNEIKKGPISKKRILGQIKNLFELGILDQLKKCLGGTPAQILFSVQISRLLLSAFLKHNFDSINNDNSINKNGNIFSDKPPPQKLARTVRSIHDELAAIFSCNFFLLANHDNVFVRSQILDLLLENVGSQCFYSLVFKSMEVSAYLVSRLQDSSIYVRRDAVKLIGKLLSTQQQQQQDDILSKDSTSKINHVKVSYNRGADKNIEEVVCAIREFFDIEFEKPNPVLAMEVGIEMLNSSETSGFMVRFVAANIVEYVELATSGTRKPGLVSEIEPQPNIDLELELDLDLGNLATESLVLFLKAGCDSYTISAANRARLVLNQVLASSSNKKQEEKASGKRNQSETDNCLEICDDICDDTCDDTVVLVSKLIGYIGLREVEEFGLDTILLSRFEYLAGSISPTLDIQTAARSSYRNHYLSLYSGSEANSSMRKNREFTTILNGALTLARNFATGCGSHTNNHNNNNNLEKQSYKEKVDMILRVVLNLVVDARARPIIESFRLFTKLLGFLWEFRALVCELATRKDLEILVQEIGNYKLGSVAIGKLTSLVLWVARAQDENQKRGISPEIETALENRLSVDLDEAVQVAIISACSSHLVEAKNALSSIKCYSGFLARRLNVLENKDLHSCSQPLPLISIGFIDFLLSFMDDSSCEIRLETIKFLHSLLLLKLKLNSTFFLAPFGRDTLRCDQPNQDFWGTVSNYDYLAKLLWMLKHDETSVRIGAIELVVMLLNASSSGAAVEPPTSVRSAASEQGRWITVQDLKGMLFGEDSDMRVVGIDALQAILQLQLAYYMSNSNNGGFRLELRNEQGKDRDQDKYQENHQEKRQEKNQVPEPLEKVYISYLEISDMVTKLVSENGYFAVDRKLLKLVSWIADECAHMGLADITEPVHNPSKSQNHSSGLDVLIEACSKAQSGLNKKICAIELGLETTISSVSTGGTGGGSIRKHDCMSGYSVRDCLEYLNSDTKKFDNVMDCD